MTQENHCSKCPNKHDCASIYERMGKTKGQSVVLKVIVAFLLPILIFIAVLAISQELFADRIDGKTAQAIIPAVVALGATLIWIAVIYLVNKTLAKRSGRHSSQGE